MVKMIGRYVMFLTKNIDEARKEIIAAINKHISGKYYSTVQIIQSKSFTVRVQDFQDFGNLIEYKFVLRYNTSLLKSFYVGYDVVKSEYLLSDDVINGIYKNLNETLVEMRDEILKCELDSSEEFYPRTIQDLKIQNNALADERKINKDKILEQVNDQKSKELIKELIDHTIRVSESIGKNGNRIMRMRTKISQKRAELMVLNENPSE